MSHACRRGAALCSVRIFFWGRGGVNELPVRSELMDDARFLFGSRERRVWIF